MAQIDDLAADVVAWLYDRSDIASMVPSLVRLAEVDFNARIRTDDMHRTAVIAKASGVYPLPPDYVEWRLVTVAGVNRRVDMVGEDFFERATSVPPNPNGPPWFVIRGGNIVVSRGDGDLTLLYYAKVPPLTEGDNWLYAKSPGSYLFTVAGYGAKYLGDNERAAEMFEMAANEIASLNDNDMSERWAAATQAPRGLRP